ncbi:MAG: ATP-binding protein, partial [Bacteroidota bacterium]
LFEPFVRGSNAANTEGSGLGLRITRRILEFHQATIEHDMDDLGRHVFSLRFPLRKTSP